MTQLAKIEQFTELPDLKMTRCRLTINGGDLFDIVQDGFPGKIEQLELTIQVSASFAAVRKILNQLRFIPKPDTKVQNAGAVCKVLRNQFLTILNDGQIQYSMCRTGGAINDRVIVDCEAASIVLSPVDWTQHKGTQYTICVNPFYPPEVKACPRKTNRMKPRRAQARLKRPPFMIRGRSSTGIATRQ